jgi:ketosteroid isomerase-like protein
LSHLHPGTEMLLEMHEVGVAVSGDMAFAHYLSRCGGMDAEGNEHAMWMRATVCCRRTRDGWRIAHEHYSAPIDPETNKVLELSP